MCVPVAAECTYTHIVHNNVGIEMITIKSLNFPFLPAIPCMQITGKTMTEEIWINRLRV